MKGAPFRIPSSPEIRPLMSVPPAEAPLGVAVAFVATLLWEAAEINMEEAPDTEELPER